MVGAFVRGLSMRDVEALCEEAGLGKLSISTASRICRELRERFEAFKRRDLYQVRLLALFVDAIFLNVRPKDPKEGVLCTWGFTEEGSGFWLASRSGCGSRTRTGSSWGRDLIGRSLGAPMLVVADGAPGLIKAVEQCWPASDRQHCSVHRARNLIAKVPEQEREPVRRAYWKALDEARGERDAVAVPASRHATSSAAGKGDSRTSSALTSTTTSGLRLDCPVVTGESIAIGWISAPLLVELWRVLYFILIALYRDVLVVDVDAAH